MSQVRRQRRTIGIVGWAVVVTAGAHALAQGPAAPPPGGPTATPTTNLMDNPYEMLANWPRLGPGMKWGAAIGIIPDGTGGTWMHFRSEPPIIHFDDAGTIVKSFGNGLFVQAHGFCQDRDGNFWAGDSGPFADNPASAGKGFQMFKFSPDGRVLMTLGKAGVSKAGRDTFVGPTACAIAPNGDVVIADGHWPRPKTAQQDGDRLVQYTTSGQFVREFGRKGSRPGEFMGPHALAFDSRGRLFVADRSNNRVQVLDQNFTVLDEWRHFGRPSGIAILRDDTLLVSDSESGQRIDGPADSQEGGGSVVRNPGWKNGIRIGSARDGSLRSLVEGTRPEGLAGDELGNIFGGLTGGCDASRSGGCLQKFVRRGSSSQSSLSQGSSSRNATDITAADIKALLQSLPKDRTTDQLMRVVDIGRYNVALATVTRAATAKGGGSLSHDKITEVYYVLRGSGTQVTGGTIVDATPTMIVPVGPSVRGSSITGGRSGRLGPGDVQVIPPGVAHMWSAIDAGGIDYLVFRVDPEHVLPQK